MNKIKQETFYDEVMEEYKKAMEKFNQKVYDEAIKRIEKITIEAAKATKDFAIIYITKDEYEMYNKIREYFISQGFGLEESTGTVNSAYKAITKLTWYGSIV